MAVLLSVLSTLVLSSFVLSTFAQYSLNFKDPSSSLTYTYDSPIDFTNAKIQFKLNLDLEYYLTDLGEGSRFPLEILKVQSETGEDGTLFDILSVELISTGTHTTPPPIMVLLSSPRSSGGALDSTSYCLMIGTYDYTDKVISIIKTGPSFTLSIDGYDSFYCTMSEAMGVEGTGKMEMSTVNIGENLKGCTSLLSFSGLDLLNPDECGFPLNYITGDVTYFEGTCDAAIPDTSVVCPTTKPPTKPPAETTTIPEISTPKKETEPPVKETTQPEIEPEQPTTEEQLPTDKPETEKPETEKPETEKPETLKPETQKPETQKPDTDEPKTLAPVDNNTDDDDDDDEEIDGNYVLADEEAATGNESKSSSVVIIIGVVGAGILVVVVLLYVGYRFHFRDKGSYKLEETKGEPNGEDFGNEYTDLNPTSKDQEWYL